MFFSKVIELDEISGNVSLNLWGDTDYNDNDKKLVKIFELLILNFPIEIEFDLDKKELTICDELSKINGIIIIQTHKSEKRFGYRVIIEMTLNSDGLTELIRFIAKHDFSLGFKCISTNVFGVINDHDGSFIQVPKVNFEMNKEVIKAILK